MAYTLARIEQPARRAELAAQAIAVKLTRDALSERRTWLYLINLKLKILGRSREETAELVSKVHELLQVAQDPWVSIGYAINRPMLEIICSDCRLDGVSTVPPLRKPFDGHIESFTLKQVWLTEHKFKVCRRA